MRKFSYLKDYSIISTTINGYISQLEKEISLLNNNDEIYFKALILINKFKEKYPDLYLISRKINEDLIKPENINYYYEVILPMNYSEDIMLTINDKFSKYIEIPKGIKK